jgi:hypothetical protein
VSIRRVEKFLNNDEIAEDIITHEKSGMFFMLLMCSKNCCHISLFI